MASDRQRRDGGRSGRDRAGATIGALLGGAGGAAVLALALALRFREVLSGRTGPWRVEIATEVGVTAVGVLVASWLAGSALVAAVCLVVRATGASWRTGERLVHRYAPQVVRKALVLAVGAGLGLGLASGASAAAPVPTPAPVTATSTDLGWVVTSPGTPTPEPAAATSEPVPEEAAVPAPVPTEATVTDPVPLPTGASVTDPAPPGAPASATTVAQTTADVAPVAGTVVVASGDTLWGIAARHLPADATAAEIAAAWPRWHDANAAVVGADPDVIQPGQVLTVAAAAGEGSR